MDGTANVPAYGTVTIKVHYLRADRFAFGHENGLAKSPLYFWSGRFFYVAFVCLSCLM